jgi:acyl phosphate:glycerol-3-phosphate acyltransferase
MLELGVKLLLSYLIGTVLGSLVLGRIRGVDIRRMGSGNAGATNALRTQGKLFGFAVLFIDVAKGIFAVLWLPMAVLPGIGIDADVPRAWLTVACGFAVIVGHVYPVWFEFRGGKGVASVVGVMAAVDPRLLAPMLITWCGVLLLSGYVSLASIVTACVLVLTVLLAQPGNLPLLTLCICVAAFVLYTHRGNIARMRNGQESRVRRLWLFRPRAT